MSGRPTGTARTMDPECRGDCVPITVQILTEQAEWLRDAARATNDTPDAVIRSAIQVVRRLSTYQTLMADHDPMRTPEDAGYPTGRFLEDARRPPRQASAQTRQGDRLHSDDAAFVATWRWLRSRRSRPVTYGTVPVSS